MTEGGAPSQPMNTYFLSYARADAQVALRFADDLIAAGVSLWVDQYDIRPSQHWDRAVEAAVRSCEGLVVMLSPRSAASANVADEVAVAIESGKQVIPIMIETCTVPLRMTRMQFVDATSDYADALRRCLSAIGQGAPPRAMPEPSEPKVAAPAAPALPPEVIRLAEARLTPILGPIASVTVRDAAAKAATEGDLYQRLADRLPEGPDRESFKAWAPQPAAEAAQPSPAAAIPPDAVRAITQALARQLGPIASHLVSREMQTAASPQALAERLAERIEAPKDRAAFFAEVRAKKS
jgi:TIR domain-containing protein